jgi:hypothetical protein
MLRECAGTPWVRFHALPHSKRYADNDVERGIILERAHALGDRLLGNEQCCWIVEAEWGISATPDDLVMSVPDPEYPQETLNFYARQERWRAEPHDRMLLSIADDGPRRAIWMRCDSGAVLAPYDGGFDLFPPSWDVVHELKAEWPDWLSDHPAGL